MEKKLLDGWPEAVKKIQEKAKEYKENLELRNELIGGQYLKIITNKKDEQDKLNKIKKALDRQILTDDQKRDCLDDFFVGMFNRRKKSILPSQYRDAYKKENLENASSDRRVNAILGFDLKGTKTTLTHEKVKELNNGYKIKQLTGYTISKQVETMLDLIKEENVEQLQKTMEDPQTKQIVNTVYNNVKKLETKDLNFTFYNASAWKGALDDLKDAKKEYEQKLKDKEWDENAPEWYILAARIMSVLALLLGVQDVKLNLGVDKLEKIREAKEKNK